MKRLLLIGLLLLVACKSSHTPTPLPTPTSLPSPSPTPLPSPTPVSCPTLSHIKAYVHLNIGTEEELLPRDAPGKVGGRMVLDTTPFFRLSSGEILPCNAEKPNCGVDPPWACEDLRGQIWRRLSGQFPWALAFEPGELDIGSSFQIHVALNKADEATFEACPRLDAPTWYQGGSCGRVKVRAQ